MPISRIKTDGIQDDAVTSAKIGTSVIIADDLAANSVTVSEIQDSAVTTAKLSGLTNASSGIIQADGDGTLSVTTADLVDDTTPQLGGNLDLNSNDITGTGNIDITGTLGVSGLITASSGIAIGGTGSGNTLDDIEEGTWSPVITGYTSGNTATFSTREGWYIKIKDTVIAYFSVALSDKGNIAGTYTLLTNIPFNNTAGGSYWGSGYVSRFGNLNNGRFDISIEMGGTSTSYGWFTRNGGTSSSYLNTSDISNTTFFEGVLIYNTTA